MDNIGSTLGGRRLEPKFCHFEGLIHMTTGSLVSIYLSMLSIYLYWRSMIEDIG